MALVVFNLWTMMFIYYLAALFLKAALPVGLASFVFTSSA